MSNPIRISCALIGSSMLGLTAFPASAQTQTFVDLQAGLGYSTNPRLQVGDSVGSGFGRISAFGFHGWKTERSETSLSAYVENSTYFRRYSNTQLFDVNARTSTQASETVRLFGSLGFSGDFGAQLSSRFYGVPLDAVPADPVLPQSSVVVVNPDLAALNQRQYRISGQGGASFVLSERDLLNTSVAAQRIFFSGESDVLNYNLYDTSVAWQRQLNERLSVGARVIANYADYQRGRSILAYGPQVTADARLDEDLQLSGAIGFVRTQRDLGVIGGKDSGFDLAFDGSLCKAGQNEQLCASVSRRTQSSVTGAAPASTSINANYSRRLNARDQVQASLGAVRSGAVREVGLGTQTFYTLAGSFDRKLNDRLSAGVNVAARKSSVFGPDPKKDLGGSIFIRNRFGSVR